MFLDPVARLRRLNRAIVREVGALDTSFLGRGRPLGAARVLHLVTAEGTDVSVIRSRLGLDSGLMSRFLRALEREALIVTEPDPADRRRVIARLTPAGQAEVAAYVDLVSDQASQLLDRAGARRDEALAAMDLVASLLNRDQIEIRLCDPDDPAAVAVLRDYFAELSQRVPDDAFASIRFPNPDAVYYRPPNGALLIAWSDEMPVGCVALKLLSDQLGEIKRLWVAECARGLGLARRLMTAVEGEARAMGVAMLQLETNHVLSEAVALYRATGWHDIPPFHGPPADIWLGKAL